jgi:membrane dipeptidase
MSETAVSAIEMHSDITIDVARRRSQGETHVLERIFLPKWQEGGVEAAFVTIGGDSPPQCPLGIEFPLQNALYLSEAMLSDIAESAGKVQIAKLPGDLSRISQEGAFPLVLHVEGSRPFEFDPSLLRLWHLMGLRSVALTWNYRNKFADGAMEARSKGGLTNAGVEFIKQVAELGMILDLAHLTEAGFWQVFESYDRTLVVSHSACRGVFNHDRNIDDEQMKALAQRNGVLGLAFYPTMVGEGPATMDKIMQHFTYAAELIGTDHLAIGPDFIDYAPDLIIPKLMKGGFSKNFDFPPELGSITQLQNLVPHFLKHGFSNEDIEKIFWKNVERVYDSSLS